jgi:NADH:ubiquinone oxidoreductase subunit 6 (subunit J)
MQYAGAIKLAILSGALGLLLAFTMPMFDVQKAQATPAIAKGQPCGNCHTGSPPSKKNLKK